MHFLRNCMENEHWGELVHPVPECEPIPLPSEWAAAALGFQPDARQAEVLDHPSPRIILNCCRQWGKTTVMAIRALHTASFYPGTEIAVLSSTMRHTAVLIDIATVFAARLGHPRRRVAGNPHSLQLPNGSRIYGTPDGRAHAPDIVLIDEAAYIDDHVIATAVHALARTKAPSGGTPASCGNPGAPVPNDDANGPAPGSEVHTPAPAPSGAAPPSVVEARCGSRRSGQLWLLGTPNGQSGLFYNVWHAAGPPWFRCQVTIEEAPFATAAFFEEQRRLFPFTFRQDFHCEFLPPPGALFTRELVDGIGEPASRAG